MPELSNLDVARALYEIADLLEVQGGDPFRVRAYRRAAQSIETAVAEVAELARQGRLTAIEGVGRAIAAKIEEYLTTGRMEYLEELRRAVPPGVLELTRVPGLGARTAHLLYRRLGIDSLDRLELAARQGDVRDLAGMGPKKEMAILEGLRKLRRRAERAPLGAVRPIAEGLVERLRQHPAVLRAEVAGSIRRCRDTVGDIDVVVASRAPAEVLHQVRRLPVAGQVLEEAENAIRMTTSLGRRVEVHVVPPERYGVALLEMTGSAAHLEALGDLPQRAATEEEVYRCKGLPYIEPELREGLGEVEAAREGRLPRLLTRRDLKGDLHTHTTASDGTATAAEMMEAAKALGHQYVAICDHSRSLTIARGLSEERLRMQAAEIRRLNRGERRFRLLHGVEVDILRDGSLDFPDEVLRELDVVVASIHSAMHLDAGAQTERLLRAIANPHVDIIGHPTGRVLGRRDPYPLDFDRIVEACARTGTALEISASPSRLDLSDLHARLAKHRGVKLVINTDAHAIPELASLDYGVGQARRAWLEPKDVVNTMDLDELLAWLAKEKG